MIAEGGREMELTRKGIVGFGGGGGLLTFLGGKGGVGEERG